MAKMKAVQVPKAGGEFEVVEREIPQPGPGQVRIKVQACGVCHSDVLTKEGGWPGITYPRVPGHEVAGVIDAAIKDHATAIRRRELSKSSLLRIVYDDGAGGDAVAGVEGRLAAAALQRHVDDAARVLQELDGGKSDRRADQIDEAGDEQTDPPRLMLGHQTNPPARRRAPSMSLI